MRWLILCAPLLMGASCSQIFSEDSRYCSCQLDFETANECEFDKFVLTGEWVKNELGKETDASLNAP